MMSELFASLLTFALVSTISPGGATTLATASGAQVGYMRSIPLMAGIAVGLASLVGAAALGLGSITKALPRLELILRIIGSLYFLWLAWTIGRQAAPGTRTRTDTNPIGFVAGLLLLWAIQRAGPWPSLLRAPSAGSQTTLSRLQHFLRSFSDFLQLFHFQSGAQVASGWRARSARTPAGAS
jgi:LysE type translocator